MLIVPLDSRFSRGRLPLVTLLLVLINSIVFFAIQGNDDRYREEAYRDYFEGGLCAIEFPHYLEKLRTADKAAAAAEWQNLADRGQPEALIPALLRDRDYRRYMESGPLLNSDEDDYAAWRPLRDHYDSLNRRVVGDRYSFNPAQPSAVTMFTHMFLHGSWDHLLGNMVMLLLVGILVEMALGPLLFPLLYLLGGLCAVGVYWLVNFGQDMPVLGASGAIASVMGMFTVLYGLRKVRFFYTLLFYFDFIKLPAIVLLPYWLGWEVLQHFIYRGAHVAYEAHAGGLAGGALLAWAARRRVGEDTRQSLDRPDQDAQWDQNLQQGIGLMARLEFDRARLMFESLHVQRPTDLRPLLQLFRIAKSNPASEVFHQHAQALLEARLPERDALFDEYWQTAKPQPRLSTALLIALLNRYAITGDCVRVDRLLGALLRQGCHQREVANILNALSTRVSADKGRAYRALAAKQFSA